MKPALAKAIPEHPTGRKCAPICAAPAKAAGTKTRWAVGSQVVVRIGGGKNRALASDAQLCGIGFHGKKPQQAWSGLSDCKQHWVIVAARRARTMLRQ